MVSVIVPYHNNRDGLSATLVMLQSQLVPPDRIVVVDTSKKQEGLSLARRYSTHDVPLVVECAQVPIYKAWNLGIELSGEGSDCLIINDDLLFPQNLIDVMTLVRAQVPALAFVPATPPRQHAQPTVTEDFPWYTDVNAHVSLADWMPGFCFYLTAECVQTVGLFDERFQVWYGDTDYEKRIMEALVPDEAYPVVKIDSLYVYHFGASSFNYKNPVVRQKIAKDRKLYEEKYSDR